MKMGKMFTALFGCLLIGNLGFAGITNTINDIQDTDLRKASPFQQETKFAVISGTIFDSINPRTVLITHENRVVAGSIMYGAPEAGTEIRAMGTFDQVIKHEGREYRHYRLTRVSLD
jgi:hypothetical protein